jgi:hypothetical protein
MLGNHRAKMKNRQGTGGPPCYFSTLDTVIAPIDEVTLRLQAPYPFYGFEPIHLLSLRKNSSSGTAKNYYRFPGRF